MALQTDPMQFSVQGNIFQVSGVRNWDPNQPFLGSITVNISNGSGDWIDLVLESIYPNNTQISTSGHLANNSQLSQSYELVYHRNKTIKMTRWRPGMFGIPGNGGGEVFFVIPDSGDVVIDVSVTG